MNKRSRLKKGILMGRERYRFVEEKATFEELLGKTLVDVKVNQGGDDSIEFVTDKGDIYKQYHDQDCCEAVDIEDICGNVKDLIGSPITLATETSDGGETGKCDHQTWTFYNIGTVKGTVSIRWYGRSNGYYSERVDFKKLVRVPVGG